MLPIEANPGVGLGVGVCVGIGNSEFDGLATTVGWALRPVSAFPHPTSAIVGTRPTSKRPNAVDLIKPVFARKIITPLPGLLDALWPLPPLLNLVSFYPNSNAEDVAPSPSVMPPASRTLPSFRRVAVWPVRPEGIGLTA
jgi:hypothetical protein